MKLEEIDPNFAVTRTIGDHTFCFTDCEQPPLRIYGLMRENGAFCRLPRSVAERVSEAVLALYAHTAGGRVRFVTDSKRIAIRVASAETALSPHMAFTAKAGFDVYAQSETQPLRYYGTFKPPIELGDGFEGIVDIGSGEQLVTINFPLYGGVKKLWIGIEEGASMKAAPDYTYETPVVFYGSSITQGGCASRPGTMYSSIVCRRLNCDFINLGFSGAAKAEDAIVEYISGLDMRVFVLDYDHNASTAEYLRKTHEKVFLAVRAKHPDLPVIMMPRPKYYLKPKELERRETVERTYLNALAAGDKNVYYIDNLQLTSVVRDDGTVDGVHPTDAGHLDMANALTPVLERALKSTVGK